MAQQVMADREAKVDASGSVVEAALAPKQPPPEPLTDLRTRRWIITSFWAIIALLGLPIWYATTTVPRANLPLGSMQSWSEGNQCRLSFPVHVAIEGTHVPLQTVQALAKSVQSELDHRKQPHFHHLHLSAATHEASGITYFDAMTGDARDNQADLIVRLVAVDGRQSPVVIVEPHDAAVKVEYDLSRLSNEAETRSLATFITHELESLFEEERATLYHLLSSSPAFGQDENFRIQDFLGTELEKRSNRAFKYASTYHLTFSLFSGSATPSSWDIQAALDGYLAPFLESLSSISTFTVDSQVQLFASLSPSLHGPQFDEASGKWTLLQSDLSAFINAAEWPLSPSIGDGPTLNFVLYAPSEGQAPLVIQENGGTSWLIPQWGGVQILNPLSAKANASVLTRDDLESVMRTFTDQLGALLGLPRTPASLPLRLSSLTRERAASLILSASSTLGALGRLTLKLTAIAIPDNVADSVQSAIHHLESACNDLAAGQFADALANARIAEAEAEQAFFDPSMVGQVYFPDEHKVAVYVPLLGPMAVPLVMAALKELKKLRT